MLNLIVPPKVAAVVTKKTEIIIMSMGSNSDCDAQFLFFNDVLGWTEGHIPRHARIYEILSRIRKTTT